MSPFSNQCEKQNFYPASTTFPLSHRRSCLPGFLSSRTSRDGLEAGRNSLHGHSRACKHISTYINHCAKTLTGVDLSLDGLRAVRCLNATGSAVFAEVRRFLRVAKWVYKAGHASMTSGWRSSFKGRTVFITSSSRCLRERVNLQPMFLSGG